MSLLLGTVVTLLASVMPALRATRVPPIAAVREGAELPPSRHGRPLGEARDRRDRRPRSPRSRPASSPTGSAARAVALLLGLGVLSLFVGVALAAPRLVKPITRIVGWPARRAGVAGELAGANSVRNPSRTASTAAALMIGLTLVTVVAVLGAGLRTSVEGAVTRPGQAAYVLDGNDGEPFGAAEGEELAKVDGVKTASHVRYDTALLNGEESDVTGIDPATIGSFYQFDWVKGSDETVASLPPDEALVTEVLRRRQERRGRRPDDAREPVRRQADGRRARDLRPAGDRPDARRRVSITQQAFDDVVPAGQEPVHVHRRRPGARRPRSSRRRPGSATPRSTRRASSRRTT